MDSEAVWAVGGGWVEAVGLSQFKSPVWALLQIVSVRVKYLPGTGLAIPILHRSFHLQKCPRLLLLNIPNASRFSDSL